MVPTFFFLGREIPFYGLMLTLGVLTGGFAGYRLCRRWGLSTDRFLITACYLFLFGMLGAKLAYLALSLDQIEFARLADPAYLSAVVTGGFVFYGGIPGGALGAALAARIHKIPVLSYLYLCVPCLPLVHAFGRIGCFFAGCCFGTPYDGPGAVVYRASFGAPVGTPLFPVQLAEAAANLMIFLFLLFRLRRRGPGPAQICWYLLLYAPVRFVLEFFRYDAVRGSFWYLSTSQWISLPLFAAALLLLRLTPKLPAFAPDPE